MKKKLFVVTTLLFLITGVIVFSNPAFADCNGVETNLINCGETDSGIGQVLSLFINIFSVAVGIVGAVGIAICGVQYLTAGDNETKLAKSKRRLFEIIIGLAAYALLFGIAQWLLAGTVNPSDIQGFEMPESQTGTGGGSGSGGGSGGGRSDPSRHRHRLRHQMG